MFFESGEVAKTVLVAGGAGYIGAHVCKTLAQRGWLPVVMDKLSTGRQDFVRWGSFIHASVSDVSAVRQAISTYKIDAVIDLAGSIEVAESVANPLKYYENNVAAKIAFLHTLKACAVKSFIFSSSAAVYGEPQITPISESHPLAPQNPYGWSKLFFEQLLRDFRQAGGPNWVTLRYFNAAGASPDGDIGECHEPETHLIPRACQAALKTAPALEIFGDGNAIRDYVHVLDLADAHVLALEALEKNHACDVYNLGTGTGVCVNEVLACFARLGITVPYVFKPCRPGDVGTLVADASKAKHVLGWKPHYTAIDDMVKSAYAWHSKIA